VPSPDEAAEYTATAFEPMAVLTGAMALSFLLDKVCDAVRRLRHGGAIVDVRAGQISIRSNPAVPADTLLVVSDNDVRTVRSPTGSSLDALVGDVLVSSLRENPQ
jgi:hypothetical protein